MIFGSLASGTPLLNLIRGLNALPASIDPSNSNSIDAKDAEHSKLAAVRGRKTRLYVVGAAKNFQVS
jgi:hypothetical protein